jgi:hypothetical protein
VADSDSNHLAGIDVARIRVEGAIVEALNASTRCRPAPTCSITSAATASPRQSTPPECPWWKHSEGVAGDMGQAL